MNTLVDEELTKPQQKTFREIQKFIEINGFPPTVDELAKRLHLTKGTVHGSIDRLISKGYLRRVPNKARSLEVVKMKVTNVIDVVRLPLLGSVTAGIPISTEEQDDGHIYVQRSVVGYDECFALRIVGQSMKNADIQDGDHVIVRKQPLAEHGDIVVVSLDGETTVKRLSMKKGQVRLMPENRDFNPIDITHESDFRILGRVIATRRVVSQHLN